MDMRDEFQKWLVSGKTRKHSPEVILSCMDKISEYAVRKKMSAVSFWAYTHHNVFSPIYKRLLEAKMLRITDRNTHKVFIVAGQLYLRFLKEKPFARKEAVPAPDETTNAALDVAIENPTQKDIKPDDVIACEPKGGTRVHTVQPYPRLACVASSEPSKLTIDLALVEQLTNVLSERFSNGYRLNSPIEMARFRAFAAEVLGGELTLSDAELEAHIAACGTNFEGKVYAVFIEDKERIEKLAKDYFADGAQVIFFAEFYAKNENWLFEANVISENMLICVLSMMFLGLSFTKTYFGYTNATVSAVLASEILRVWGGNVLLTYDQLAERLPYIPYNRIKYALGQNGDFIWSSVETFSHISRIKITETENETIRSAAASECDTRGYALIKDLPLGEIEARNHELSITAVHNAIYRICLSDKFDKRGKIVTRKGDVFDALIIMKEYCRGIDKCSLDDLLNYEKELTGEVHRWIPMEAGNTVLVRIDKETYVADRFVHFNTDLIDEAIELVVKGDYLPLKSFMTFVVFPDCGRTWNLFLLESYCRRFSRKFRFDTLSVNSRNAGVVVRKSCGLDYTNIMTDAVVKANIPLKDSAVGKFLYENGYTGRSTVIKASEIVYNAKERRISDAGN